MCIRPLNERSLKLSHQNSSFFQTTPKEDEIKEFHKRRFSQLICHQMKVLGKWPEKLFLLDTPFEVTRTTNHAISAEDSSCVSPLYERKGTRTVLHQLGPFWGPCSWSLGFQGAGRKQGCYPGSAPSLSSPWSSQLPTLQLGAHGKVCPSSQKNPLTAQHIPLQDNLELKIFPNLDVFLFQFVSEVGS